MIDLTSLLLTDCSLAVKGREPVWDVTGLMTDGIVRTLKPFENSRYFKSALGLFAGSYIFS